MLWDKPVLRHRVDPRDFFNQDFGSDLRDFFLEPSAAFHLGALVRTILLFTGEAAAVRKTFEPGRARALVHRARK